MKGFKKAAAYVVGSMVIAGAGVYFALPKEAKQSVKDFIGNLRSGTDALSAFLREKRKEPLIKAFHYYGIIFFFAVGAGIGGNLSVAWGIHTIWVSCILLLISMVFMWYEKYRK